MSVNWRKSESCLLSSIRTTYEVGGRHVTLLVRPSAVEVEEALRNLESSTVTVLLGEEPSKSFAESLELQLNKKPEAREGVFIQTSGTTGDPKLVFVPRERLWDSTNADHDAKIWGLTFPPHKMAGLQVIAQAIASGGQIVAPNVDIPPLQKLEEFGEASVEAISGTASFWRLASGYQGHLQETLRFLTLGGEIADQKILNRLKTQFPESKISHVYATSETGAVFSVSDGLAGFPASYVGKIFRSGKSISIIEDEIVVHLPGSSNINIHTGDSVVLDEDRYVFDGRYGSHINVGGTKVSLTEVDRVAIEFDGVFDCQASGIPNPFSGQSVLLKVIWADESKENELLSHLRKALPRAAVPALIETVSEFTINENQKKVLGGHS